MTAFDSGSRDPDSDRRSRIVGTICMEVTRESISMGGSCGWAKTMGTWKLETWGLSYGVTPPFSGREIPLPRS